jgi:phage terminase large subunit-like protein
MGAVNGRGASAAGQGVARRVGIIGGTYYQAREVMVLEDSGIMACAPRDSRPDWIAGRKMLHWPKGAQATLYLAFDPEALRGPQFGAVWADELAKWKQGPATRDMVELCLRLGRDPRASMTTYLRDLPVMRDMLERGSTA